MGKGLIVGAILGVCVTVVFSLVAASKIVSTGKADFCRSCHEMKVFYETWEQGPHGPGDRGIVRAQCADCHLPHDGILSYLVSKLRFGLNDFLGHVRGKGQPEHWLAHWEHREPYRHQAYESGCRECHERIIAPGIPLKAVKAHKEFELGLTRENCISCHQRVGHGDVVTAMRVEAREQALESAKKH